MNRSRRIGPSRAVAIAVAMVAVAIGCGDPAPDADGGVLRWSAIPDANTDLLRQKYEPVSVHLSERLGVAVEYVPVADYVAAVEAFRNGDVQLAWFGGLTGVQARAAVPGAAAIAQGVEDPEYYSYFVAHPSTGIARSDDFPAAIADHPFAFGSESSTSGRLMPEFFIREATGLSPREFFREGFSFSGAHDKTAKWVEEGTRIKAGVLSYRKYDAMVEAGQLDPEKCRIVWRTPSYADYNFTAHPDLESLFGEGFTRRLQKALLELDDPALLAGFLRSGFIEASAADFARIEETARRLGLVR